MITRIKNKDSQNIFNINQQVKQNVN